MAWLPEDVRRQARSRLGEVCRVCAECNGRACAGEVPGMGGVGRGRSFVNNCDALGRLRLNLRTLHDAGDPSTLYRSFLGDLETPVMVAPMGGVALNMAGAMSEDDFATMMVDGALAAGTIAMTGDGPDPALFEADLRAIATAAGRSIPIIKPRRNDAIRPMLEAVEGCGACAVGIDVDAASLVNMTRRGQPVEPKTPRKLREIVEMTRLPVILKGIMTPDEAEVAAEAGAAAVVVSNHGGRALDDTPGTADVLPSVAERVRGKLAVWVDGGVRSGTDVLKCLALGAEAVLVGRPVAIAAIGGGTEAVTGILRGYQAELRAAMLLTGCRSLQDISRRVLYGSGLEGAAR